jgi:transglutaminase-like putative cysteine protease
MRSRPNNDADLRLMAQLCYLLLFALGVLAALVQRGHPTLVLGILTGLLPLALLARLPRRWFPGWLRQVLQILIAGCGVAWWRLRTGGAPLDVIVVESAAVIGSALALGGVAREYGLLGFISLILLGYGGLVPGRALYMPLLCIYLVVGVILMYETRTPNLASLGRGGVGRRPWSRPHANWGYRLAHLAACCVCMLLLVATFPLPQGRSLGLVPVGFRTAQELAFPMLWRQWLQPTTGLFSRGDSRTQPTAQCRDGDTAELSRDPRASRTAPAQTPSADLDAREGGGGAGVGTDLVMRVQSPAKLYWLVQVYDAYDGVSWQASAMLRGSLGALDRAPLAGSRRVEQHVGMVKAPGSRLPGAYRMVQCVWDPVDPGDSLSAGPAPLVRIDGSGSQLAGATPELPWQYRAISMVPTLDAKALPDSPIAVDRYGWNYRRLPDGRIADRVRRLAATLTQDCEAPLAKAMALQEHLRRHYAYSLTPAPIPATAEPVDFFLFESREGYCQHFAQAFTVLARAVGLPARLATGYSPGNYNLLSNCFEVYEYHAHAWTQVYIEPYGWLTFDGVAPANLRIEAGPALLRQLMDPFPESWGAHPPELSLRAPSPAPREVQPPSTESGRNPLAKAIEAIYTRAARQARSAQPSAKAVLRAAASVLGDWTAAQWQRLQASVADWAAHVGRRLQAGVLQALRFLQGLSVAAYVALTAALLLFGVLWGHRRLIGAVLATAAQRWACRRHWQRLQRSRLDEPRSLVQSGFQLLRQIMALGRFVRPSNLDAQEYAAWLGVTEPRIGADYRLVADVVQRMVYRDTPPSRADAEVVLAAIGRIHREIAARLSLAGTRRRAAPCES